MKKNKAEALSDTPLEVLKSLPQLSFSKATQRQVQIIEAAIFCYANYGFDETTYEKIAKQAKLSRPLLFHYFEDRDEIFESSIKYVRALYHQQIIEALQSAGSGKARFENYLRAAFDMSRERPEHIKFWFIVYHSAATNPKYKKINSEMVAYGVDRIEHLIRGIEGNEKLSTSIAAQRARVVQALITGAIVQMHTESDDILPKDYAKSICKAAWDIATL